MGGIKVKNIPRRRLKRKSKKSQLNKKIRKIVFTGVLVLILLTALSLSSVFSIKTVEVSGLTRYPKDDIIAATNIKIGNNWYKTLGARPKDIVTFSYELAQEQILDKFPYVQDVTVKFIPFGKVRVKITERSPEIVIQNEEGYSFIDNTGTCLEIAHTLKEEKLPVLINAKINTAVLGKAIEFQDPYVLESVRRLFYIVNITDSKSEPKLFGFISQMDFSNLGNTIIILDSRVKVNIGDINKMHEYKINFLKEVFFKKIQKDEKGSLDFSKDDNPVFVPG